jgi:hypothetical protein
MTLERAERLPQALKVPMAWLATLAIAEPGDEGDPIADRIRTTQQLIRERVNKSASSPKHQQ